MIRFESPYFLLLLLLLPPLFWYERKFLETREAVVRFPGVETLKRVLTPGQKIGRYVLPILKWLVLILLILALARPQTGSTSREFETEGIDIMLVLDISSSMRAVDFKPDRLGAAKSVAKDFVLNRHGDRIGLVVFASESFLQCPATIDYDVLLNLLEEVQIIPERFDGTAIGMAIANAVNRLRDLEGKSKVIILLSDGRNNAGELDPLTAADLAKTFGIKIYTIGAGKKGQALYPVGGGRFMPVQVDIDEELLTEIARRTGGRYFRATDEKSLAKIYKEISDLEKSEIKVREYINYFELYPYFLLVTFFTLGIYILLQNTKFRKIPS